VRNELVLLPVMTPNVTVTHGKIAVVFIIINVGSINVLLIIYLYSMIHLNIVFLLLLLLLLYQLPQDNRQLYILI
jgi:hypothetical protein